jgi:hypothetical protein
MTDAQPHSPTGQHHALVWIDHHEAKIFRFVSAVSEATQHIIRDEHSAPHLHHKANSIGSGHVPVNHVHLEQVAADISDAKAILIVGPSGAKHELYKHIERRHPADGPLLAHAAKAFRDAARLGRPFLPGNN